MPMTFHFGRPAMPTAFVWGDAATLRRRVLRLYGVSFGRTFIGYVGFDFCEVVDADERPAVRGEIERLRELVNCLVANDPAEPIDDAGHVVLDLWRHDARKVLGLPEPENANAFIPPTKP